jgi:hypothetical protein
MDIDGLKFLGLTLVILGLSSAGMGVESYLEGSSDIPYLILAIICIGVGWGLLVLHERNLPKQTRQQTQIITSDSIGADEKEVKK